MQHAHFTMEQHRLVEKLECYEQPPFLKRRRNLVAFLSFLGFFNIYMFRVNLNFAIIDKFNESNWNGSMRGIILCSFYLGYTTTQLTGGLLSSKMGGVKIIGYSVLATAILTVFSPLAAQYSSYLFIAFRIVDGMFQGVVFPSIHAVWIRWAPPDEHTHLGSMAFSGSFMGVAGGYMIRGWLVNDYNWTYAFYVPSLMGIIWSIVWLAFITESPIDDRHITVEELNYIVNSIDDELTYPWMDFFTSKALFAIICAHFSANWGNYTLITYLPNYMNSFWKYDVAHSSYFSALPFIFLSSVLHLGGFFAEWLRKNKKISTTSVRKRFCCSAFISQSIFIYLAAYAKNSLQSIIYISITIGLGAFSWAGFTVNHLDIGPQYASILMAISNTFAAMPGVISPVLTFYFRKTKGEEMWTSIFLIISGMFLFGAIFYGLFASGERQPWAIVKTEERNTIIIRRRSILI